MGSKDNHKRSFINLLIAILLVSCSGKAPHRIRRLLRLLHRQIMNRVWMRIDQRFTIFGNFCWTAATDAVSYDVEVEELLVKQKTPIQQRPIIWI